MPAAGRGFAGQLQLVLVQAIAVSFPDELAADLLIRAAHFHAHRLGLDRLAVLVAQQAVEQHRFAWAIQVTRAKNEQLQRVGLRPGDVELGQVQCRAVQAQQRGVHALGGDQGISPGRDRQLGVALAIGAGLGQQLALVVMDFQVDTVHWLAAFQGLGEHVETVTVAVRGHTDVAEGEQGCRLRIVVAARGTHHRQVHAWRLQRLDAGDRQQHGLAGVACGVEVEAAAVDQFGHVQGFLGLVVVQAAVAPPVDQEGREHVRLHAEELDIDLVDVEGDHRQALGQARGQQRTTAGEADGRLHVAGFQAADRLAVQLLAIDRQQALVDGQHQLALRLQVAQAQLHLVVGELPGAVELAFDGVDQVHFAGEVLLGIQRRGEADRQRRGAIELHFGNIQHRQLAALVAFGEYGRVFALGCRGGSGRCGRRLFGWRRLVRRRRVTGTEQSQRAGQQQSFVEHGVELFGSVYVRAATIAQLWSRELAAWPVHCWQFRKAGALCAPFATQGRSHRYCTGFRFTRSLWERPCVAKGLRSSPRIPQDTR
ncbi:hypothetical protein D3C81_400950 [compost metagenome]